jgi:hypothetical protein
MAFTPLLFEGFETGGFEHTSAISGDTVISATVRAAANGVYSCLLGTALSAISFNIYEYQGTENSNAKALGFWFNFSTAVVNNNLFTIKDSANGQKLNAYITNTGIIVLRDKDNVAVDTFASSGADGGWHFFEVWYDDGSASAGWEIFLDGVSLGSGSAADFRATNSDLFRFFAASTNLFYIDDIYFGEATTSADRLGGMDIFATVGDGSATTGGDTLDAGTWANVQEIPKVDANLASYNAPAPSNTDEREAPDTLAVQTNLTGAVTDIDDDPDSPDGLWLTASGSSTARVTFPTPTGSPTVGAGLQNFRVLLRKNATGPSGSGNQALPPDAILTQTNLTGVLSAITDDPDSADGTFLDASNNNADSVCIVSFGTPTVTPSGTQNFKIWAKKWNGTGNPAYAVYLLESGTRINGGTAIATGTLTSLTGQLITASWNASLLGTANGSLVECELYVTKTGGAPAARATGSVGAVEWNSAYSVSETQPGYEVRLYENGSVVSAVSAATGTLTDAGGNTVVSLTWDATELGTADGSLVECYVNQTSGADRYIEVGAIEWNCKYPTPPPVVSGWIEADSGTLSGPSGVSGLNEIVGLTTYIRSQYSGSGSTLTHSLYRGNDVDGVTELTLGAATAGLSDFFDITNSAAIMPLITEQTRVGFGHPVGVDVDIDCTEVIGMVAHLPLVVTGRDVTTIPEVIAVTENISSVNTSRVVGCTTETVAITENDAAVNASRNVTQEAYVTEAHDTFTDPNGTLLSAHTPDVGNSWYGGLPNAYATEIQNNRVVGFGTGFDEWLVEVPGSEDCVITADLQQGPDGTSSSDLLFRSIHNTDSLDHWQLSIRAGTTHQIDLYRASSTIGFASWTNTILGSNLGKLRSVRIVLKGSSIKVYVDGVKLFDITDSEHSSGTWHGFRLFGNVGNWIDNFLVQSGDEARTGVSENLATINRERGVSCTPEVIAVTENDATVIRGAAAVPRDVTCTPEVIAVTESDSTINRERGVTSIPEVIAATENDAQVNSGRSIATIPESVAVTENDSTIQTDRGVTSIPEVIAVTENDATIQTARGVATDPEVILVTENAATINSTRIVFSIPEPILVTENDSTINRARGVTSIPEIILVTESDATISTNVPLIVACTPEVVLVTEPDATINRARGVTTDPEVILVIEPDATVISGANLDVTCTTEIILVTEPDATISTNVPLIVACTSEVVLVTEPDATIQTDRGVTGIPEVILVTESDATISTARTVAGISESIFVTENDSTIKIDRGVTTLPEVVLVTEPDATIVTGKLISCIPELIALYENDSTINRERGVLTLPELIAIFENNATVIRGGAVTRRVMIVT